MQLEHDLLRTAQLKVTPQRTAILQLLKQSREHPGVDKVHKMILNVYPSVSLATIYKTLELFREKGLIQEVAVSSRKVGYDGQPDFHPHLVCNSCKEIKDMSAGEIPEEYEQEAVEKHGYKVSSKQLFLYGLCEKCQDKSQTIG